MEIITVWPGGNCQVYYQYVFLKPQPHIYNLVPIIYSYIIGSSTFFRRFAGWTGTQVLKFQKILVSIFWRSNNSSEQVKPGDEEHKIFQNGKRSLPFIIPEDSNLSNEAVRVWNFSVYPPSMINLRTKL